MNRREFAKACGSVLSTGFGVGVIIANQEALEQLEQTESSREAWMRRAIELGEQLRAAQLREGALAEEVERLRPKAEAYDERVPDALIADLEHRNAQLAGCLTAAEGHIHPGNVLVCGQYGWSPAYQAVLNLRRRFDGHCMLKYLSQDGGSR